MTKSEALTLTHGQRIYHKTIRNPNGSPYEAIIIGTSYFIKDDWQLNAHHAGRGVLIINDTNIHQWMTSAPK